MKKETDSSSTENSGKGENTSLDIEEKEQKNGDDNDDMEEITEKEKSTSYASFNQRLVALGVDIILMYIFIIPFVKLTTNALYGPIDPREGMLLLQNLTQEVGVLNISVYEAMQRFMQSNYAYRWFMENIFQTVVMGAIIVSFWARYGVSPGMWLFGICVEDENTHEPPGWVQSVFRFCVCIISFIPLMLGFFWVVFNKKRQAWHDMAAGTVVVRKRWKWKRWGSG